MKRFVYAAIAFLAWCFVASEIIDFTDAKISDEVQFLSLAIIVAGALAGGG